MVMRHLLPACVAMPMAWHPQSSRFPVIRRMRRDGLHGFMLPPFRRDIGGAERGGEQLGWLSGRRLKHTPLWQAEFDQMGLLGVSLCTSFFGCRERSAQQTGFRLPYNLLPMKAYVTVMMK